jgi:hypothetical protein
VAGSWFRTEGGCEWQFTTFGKDGPDVARQRPRFLKIRDSWHREHEKTLDVFGVVTLATGMLALAVVSIAGRPRSIARFLSSPLSSRVFVLVVAAFGIIQLVGSFLNSITRGSSFNTDLDAIGHLCSVLLIVAVASLIAAMPELLSRRRSAVPRLPLPALMNLNIGLLGLGAVLLGYDFAVRLNESAGEAAGQTINAVQAIIIIIVITWDILTSGETFTNPSSEALPRTQRVLMFCSYVVFLAACITNGAPLRIFGTHDVPFEAESWTRDGLIRLGIPYLLTVFMMRTFLRDSHMQDAESSTQ